MDRGYVQVRNTTTSTFHSTSPHLMERGQKDNEGKLLDIVFLSEIIFYKYITYLHENNGIYWLTSPNLF